MTGDAVEVRRGLRFDASDPAALDSALRAIVDYRGDVTVSRRSGGDELVGYVFSQVDETKNALVRVVAGEVRDFLQATDLATELQKALTSLSFEIKTEIRFIPNDAGGVKPEVKAEIEPRKRRGKKSEPPPPDDEEIDGEPES